MSQATEALGVVSQLIEENGRWVVYLGVEWWDPATDGHPVETIWHRLADFPTFEAAWIAAQYYQRGANRDPLRAR